MKMILTFKDGTAAKVTELQAAKILAFNNGMHFITWPWMVRYYPLQFTIEPENAPNVHRVRRRKKNKRAMRKNSKRKNR